MVVIRTPSGPMTVRRARPGQTIIRDGRGTVAQISENLMTTRRGIVDRRTGKVIAPVGTSPVEAARRAEQARQQAQKIAAEKKAAEQKQKELIEKQREQAELRKQQLERQKAQEKKIRQLSAQQKRQFFIEQAQVSRAAKLEKLRQRGARLTPKAKQLILEAKKIMERRPTITKKILPPERIEITKQKKLRFAQKIVRSTIDKLKQLKISKKIIKDFEEGTTPLEIRIKTLPISKEKKDKLLKFAETEKELVKGFVKGIKEEPEKVAIVTVASLVTPVVLARLGGTAVASKLIKPILKRVPKSVKKKGGKAVSRFLTTAYVTSTGLEIAATPQGKRAEKTGRILSTEIVPFKIGSKIGVQGLLRNEIKKDLKLEVSKLSPSKREAFKEYMKQTEVFGKFEPKAKNVKLNNIESIKDTKAQSTIRNFLKKNKDEVVLGGSVAQTSQVSVQRKLGDMDLYLEGRLKPNQAAKQLADKLKKSGVKRVSNVGKSVTIEGKKAVEFHDIDRVLRNIEEVIPAWQNARKYIITTPEGIRIQRIGLQAKRKLVAAFADPKRFATGKYKKDLKDFKRIADQLFIRAEKNARQSFFFKKKKIKGIEKIFKLKVRRRPIKKFKRKVVKKKLVEKKPKKKKTKEEIKLERLKNLKKAREVKKAKKKIKPSQKPVKKIIPSQLKIKRIRKIRPSQLPKKRKVRKPSPPSQPPTKRPKRKPPKKPSPPSQLPTKFPKKKPSPPSQPPTKIPTRRVPKPPKKPIKIIRLKKRKKKVTKKRKLQQAYNVKARPIKKFKKQKQPKLVKVNKRPLGKRDAKNLRNYIADTSLARTSKIVKTKGKPKRPIIKVPKNYAKNTKKKFRTYRVVKGKKKPLRKGTVIERGTRLLDTRQERKGITLRKRISQIAPTRKFKKTLSVKQLATLKKGREKLKELRKK